MNKSHLWSLLPNLMRSSPCSKLHTHTHRPHRNIRMDESHFYRSQIFVAVGDDIDTNRTDTSATSWIFVHRIVVDIYVRLMPITCYLICIWIIWCVLLWSTYAGIAEKFSFNGKIRTSFKTPVIHSGILLLYTVPPNTHIHYNKVIMRVMTS